MKRPRQEDPQTNTRWWEFYLVRYLLGSIFGASILFILNSRHPGALYAFLGSATIGIIELQTSSVLILAALGFAYCYIASAPILVFHAARGVLFNKPLGDIRLGVLLSIVAASVIASAIFLCMAPAKHRTLAFLTLLLLILFLQLAILTAGTRNGWSIILEYYRELVEARSVSTPKQKSYIESYKHLREHGNAFAIVLLEMIFGVLLYLAPTTICIFAMLVLWISPAAYVWLVGSKLEHNLLNVK